ncbi:hypothetical protein D9M70_446380 [compost metagenome]
MDGAGRPFRQQLVQPPQRQQMDQQEGQPAEPAKVRQRVILQPPGARQCQAGQRRESQAERRQGAPPFAQRQQGPHRDAQCRHQQRHMLAHGIGHEADDLAQRGQRPPTGPPGQQQLRQAFEIERAQAQLLFS